MRYSLSPEIPDIRFAKRSAKALAHLIPEMTAAFVTLASEMTRKCRISYPKSQFYESFSCLSTDHISRNVPRFFAIFFGWEGHG